MVKKLIFLLIFSRIAIIIGSYYFSGPLHANLFRHIESFANQWDSPHYLHIVERGYINYGDAANFIVFLPLYPLTIKLMTILISDPKLASLILSNIFFVVGSVIFYKLLRKDYSQKLSLLAVVLLAIFPTSYFFSSTYPESLFLLLFALSFYFLRTNRPSLGFLSASLLTLTRPFGILIWPAIAIELLVLGKRRIINLFTMSIFFIVSIGVYLSLNYGVYGDPLAFSGFLKNNWQKTFEYPWVGVLEAWRRTIHGRVWDDYRIYVGLSEAIASSIAWLLVPLAFIKKIHLRLSYATYYLFAVMLFTSTGFILSSPRYLLSIPPFFIILSSLLRIRIIRYVWIVFSVSLLFFLTTNFVKGKWSF